MNYRSEEYKKRIHLVVQPLELKIKPQNGRWIKIHRISISKDSNKHCNSYPKCTSINSKLYCLNHIRCQTLWFEFNNLIFKNNNINVLYIWVVGNNIDSTRSGYSKGKQKKNLKNWNLLLFSTTHIPFYVYILSGIFCRQLKW